MKVTLFALFTTLLMVGCGSPDLDDPEKMKEIIAEAIEISIQKRGKEGEEIYYAPNENTPFTGWAKELYIKDKVKTLEQFKDGKLVSIYDFHENGQKMGCGFYKDGKLNGIATEWYKNGQKREEKDYKDGKVVSAVVWKPNGEKCSVTNVKNGDGISVIYNDDGEEKWHDEYKNGNFFKANPR